jgi:energy-coupling factor transporter ATP-binding protein EcfA2
MSQYKFPVTDIHQAIRVTQSDFDIEPFPSLYVPLDTVRSTEQFARIRFYLGVEDHTLSDTFDGSKKILFYGHTGSGKSTELKKLHQQLHHPNLYFSVFASLVDDMDVYSFEKEDLFVLLITKLVERIEGENIDFDKSDLNRIAKDWLATDKELVKELEKSFGFEASAEASVGFDFWKFLSAKAGLKTLFSAENKTTQTIRSKIKTNPNGLVTQMNLIFSRLQKSLVKQNKGKDILFILDGTERLRGEKYDTFLDTFIRGAHLIQDLDVNIIISVPIDAYYDKKAFAGANEYPLDFLLPMVEINEQSLPVFEKIVSERINKDTFFEPNVLRYCAQFSGGNPRQLLRIVNLALQNTFGKSKAGMNHAEKAVLHHGNGIWRTLTSEHKEILLSGKFMDANDNTLDLLFNTALMEYNGGQNLRRINPLIQPFLDTEKQA